MGGIFRNHNGDWILGFTKSLPSATNNQIELSALKEGLQIIEDNNYISIKINTNSIEVIKILKEGNYLYNGIIDVYKSKLRMLKHLVMRYNYIK